MRWTTVLLAAALIATPASAQIEAKAVVGLDIHNEADEDGNSERFNPLVGGAFQYNGEWGFIGFSGVAAPSALNMLDVSVEAGGRLGPVGVLGYIGHDKEDGWGELGLGARLNLIEQVELEGRVRLTDRRRVEVRLLAF